MTVDFKYKEAKFKLTLNVDEDNASQLRIHVIVKLLCADKFMS
jgi:hypothetical protein